MPDRSLGDPGTDNGREIFWKSVANGSDSMSSSSNESGYAVVFNVSNLPKVGDECDKPLRSANCLALTYSIPIRFQSSRSLSLSVRFRWLILCLLLLFAKSKIYSV